MLFLLAIIVVVALMVLLGFSLARVGWPIPDMPSKAPAPPKISNPLLLGVGMSETVGNLRRLA